MRSGYKVQKNIEKVALGDSFQTSKPPSNAQSSVAAITASEKGYSLDEKGYWTHEIIPLCVQLTSG